MAAVTRPSDAPFPPSPDATAGYGPAVAAEGRGHHATSKSRSPRTDPRALIQMATGSGKTLLAAFAAYRLVKFAEPRRVLFLVDRANLGRQTLKEFQGFTTPDDGRKFTELYNVQRLSSNVIDPVSRVTITTIQRLYSIMRGRARPGRGDRRAFLLRAIGPDAAPVAYNPALPIEFFDFVIVDECHRSIYGLWRQVLDYFDAFIIGLTATPNKQAFGFFNKNLVMEYTHEQAVADHVNVGFDVYRIKTEITEQGGKVDAGVYVGHRDERHAGLAGKKRTRNFSTCLASSTVPSSRKTRSEQ